MKDQAGYEPEEVALLYHYCSPPTLLAIFQSSSLRLGDISAMNDSMERQWGLDVLQEELASRKDLGGSPLMEVMERAIYRATSASICLASCFSTDGDVLSQWRAYADNGAGFAIGFDPRVFQTLPISLLEVCYDRQLQAERIADGVDHIIDLYHRIGTPDTSAIGQQLSQQSGPAEEGMTPLVKWQIDQVTSAARFLVHDLVAFKSPAFREEAEVRMVHHVSLDPSTGKIELVPTRFFQALPDGRQPQLNFLMRGSVPICYTDLPIPKSAVKEVVLGPRAAVDESAIQRLLSTLGFSGVQTSRSTASYR